jgi:hypothetical protein
MKLQPTKQCKGNGSIKPQKGKKNDEHLVVTI